MSASDAGVRQSAWNELPGGSGQGQPSWEAAVRRTIRYALAGLLALGLSGCASVQEPSGHPSDETPAAPVLSSAPPEMESPFSNWMRGFPVRRPKLLIAGAAGLVLASLAGLGVRKLLRGTAPGPGSTGAAAWDAPQSPEFGSRA